MADDNAPVVEQVVTAPEVAVVGEQQPVVAAVESPVVEQQADAPVATPEAEVAKPATVAETPSLLEDAKVEGEKTAAEPEKAAEGEKPAEVKAEEKPIEVKPEDKPAETAEADKPKEEAAPEAPAPVEYKFELPENVNLTDERKTDLFGVLDTFRTDPANVQPLVDFHVAEVNRQIEHITQQQHDVFNDTRRAWRDQIKADPEMGGSGMDTTTGEVARMRDLLVSNHPVGSPEYDREAKEANEFFRITGAGDHPVLWRMLKNAARYLDEAKPLAIDVSPAPTGRQPGSKRGLLYNHPNSPNNKGVS